MCVCVCVCVCVVLCVCGGGGRGGGAFHLGESIFSISETKSVKLLRKSLVKVV